MPADGCSAGCPSTDRLAGPGPIRGRSGLLGVFCKIMSHQHAPPHGLRTPVRNKNRRLHYLRSRAH